MPLQERSVQRTEDGMTALCKSRAVGCQCATHCARWLGPARSGANTNCRETGEGPQDAAEHRTMCLYSQHGRCPHGNRECAGSTAATLRMHRSVLVSNRADVATLVRRHTKVQCRVARQLWSFCVLGSMFPCVLGILLVLKCGFSLESQYGEGTLKNHACFGPLLIENTPA